ncbi:glycosyltransferase family 4 protein [Pontibaca salina]|uniref:Glycosyltransferase family 4 protein n=1 Tax=Pontibaca salina TaxID=2795731 RepID=A0A934HNS2_9RHOB|nr:glycosyltransferase family 4 protein [Pontibaca salina]MBI6628777.1 glycosyltransferase family 4 protein [Pontibaca salina]
MHNKSSTNIDGFETASPSEDAKKTVASKRFKVLVIAEAANPELVSVPLIGWSIAKALRAIADVHVVTQTRNRDAMLRAGWIEDKDFTAINSESVARPLWRIGEVLSMGEGKGWTTKQAIGAISYAWFERLVWRRFGARIKAGEWDIVHRVTPLTPTQSSFIAPRCNSAGVPFVLGPLNGGVPWPAGFGAERRREREFLSYIRGAYKILPGRAVTLSAAAAILVGSRYTMSEIPKKHHDRTIYLPENAIDPDRFNARASPGTAGLPLKACFVGRMVPYKGPDMLIEAAAPLLRDGRMVLEMIGDGPMMEDLKTTVLRENVASAVHFHGWLAHREVQDVMVGCDLLTFPSIREFGGGVVLEAMALGVPPLVLDYAGPGELVTSDWGYKLPLGTRAEIVSKLRTALEKQVTDVTDLQRTGDAAHARVAAAFTWSAKAKQIEQVYEWVLDRSGPPPLLL